MPRQYSGLEIFVTVGNITYTARQLGVSEMVVTDCDDGDNEIELTIPDDSFKVTDGGYFKTGQLMSIQWGYANGSLSQTRSGYVITKPSTTYGDTGTICKVTASTKSATLAARHPMKVSGATSVKSVISEIANRNGLTLNITGGNERLSGFAHGAWSDREVVRVLADRFGYQATYTSDSIVFAPRDYGAVPTTELIYNMGDSSNVISAELEVDAKKAKGDAKTTAVSVDPATKTVQSATSQQAPKSLAISAEDGNSWTTQLGQSATSATSGLSTISSFLVPPGTLNQQADLQKVMSTPDPALANLQSLSSGELQAKQKKKGEFTVESLGFTTATARQIVTCKGFAKRDSGNWYVVSVEHHIVVEKGYYCKWELARHGNNTKGTEKNTSPLNSQQPATSDRIKSATPIVSVNAETGQTN